MARNPNLLNSHTTNTAGDAVPLVYTTSFVNGANWQYTIYVWGTFGGATVQIQVSPDEGTTWFDVTDMDFTTKGVQNLEVSGTHVRANVSGGSGADINATIL